MTRKACFTLADVWAFGKIRTQLAAGIVGLKLPIRPVDYPAQHSMRQESHGRSFPTGRCGPLETWLAGRYIIFLQHGRDQLGRGGELFWGVQYTSPNQAARAFAGMSAFADEQAEPVRGYPLKFYGGECVTVVDASETIVVNSLVDGAYCDHRQYATRGRVLCRVRQDREDFWLVEREGFVAAYFQYELMLSNDDPMPKASSFSVSQNVLRVKFENDREAVIVKNTGGFGESNAIETFSLENNGYRVARYQSPYQHPRNTDSHNGFVQLRSGYTPTRVAEYWIAADAYIRNLIVEAGGVHRLNRIRTDNEDLFTAFKILADGRMDLADVHRGRAELHCS